MQPSYENGTSCYELDDDTNQFKLDELITDIKVILREIRELSDAEFKEFNKRLMIKG